MSKTPPVAIDSTSSSCKAPTVDGMPVAKKQYAVIGHPVAHSKSPYIHYQFAKQTGIDLSYRAIEAPLDDFQACVMRLCEAGLNGCNVTVPFKEQAWAMADERSAFAQRAGSVNTLMLHEDGRIYGDNTDGSGLVCDLKQNQQIILRGRRILLLGAGGAVRGVLEPLLAEQPELLFIANRTAAKAENLAVDFADAGKVAGGGFAAIPGSFDLIINGTAASLQGDVPPLPADCLAGGGSCYDMMYSAQPTAFMRWGQEHGAARVIDGLGMLVEQAADAFRVWHGVRPETATVLAELRGA